MKKFLKFLKSKKWGRTIGIAIIDEIKEFLDEKADDLRKSKTTTKSES